MFSSLPLEDVYYEGKKLTYKIEAVFSLIENQDKLITKLFVQVKTLGKIVYSEETLVTTLPNFDVTKKTKDKVLSETNAIDISLLPWIHNFIDKTDRVLIKKIETAEFKKEGQILLVEHKDLDLKLQYSRLVDTIVVKLPVLGEVEIRRVEKS